jgi:TRAP-type C4-dicarboxylate transport system permease small subunit
MVLRRLTAFADLLAKSLAVLAGGAVALIVLSIVYDVAARTLGISGVKGIVEYGEVLMVAVVFLSIGYAQMQHAHIAVEILVDRLPERIAQRLYAGVLGLLAIGLFWASYETMLAAMTSMERGEIRFGLVSVPVWPARWVIPVGLFSMALQCLVQSAAGFTAGRSREAVVDDMPTGRPEPSGPASDAWHPATALRS